MFGNVTGGGEISSKTNCNPTPYIQTYVGALDSSSANVAKINTRFILVMILPEHLYYTKKS